MMQVTRSELGGAEFNARRKRLFSQFSSQPVHTTPNSGHSASLRFRLTE
jgi:hypothetical protein